MLVGQYFRKLKPIKKGGEIHTNKHMLCINIHKQTKQKLETNFKPLH